MTANGHEFFTNNIYESFMDIYGHSRSVADKKNHEQFRLEKKSVKSVKSVVKKNLRVNLKSIRVKSKHYYHEEQDILEIRDSDSH